MRRTAALLTVATLALAAAPLATVSPAAAQGVNVTVGTGNIAYGYADGYWDRDHHWHAWRNREQEEAWRREHADYYYDRRHDRVANQGWRNDRWWEKDRDHH